MKSWLQGLLLSLLAATTLTGCMETDVPEKVGTQDGVKARSADPARPLVNAGSVRTSGGVTVRQDIAEQINALPGAQNASVLVQRGIAYVGLTAIGTEREPDENMKMGSKVWEGAPYGTRDQPKTAHGMTVQEMQSEGIVNGSHHGGPSSTKTGDLSEGTRRQVEDLVRRNIQGVQNVLITGEHDAAQQLSGYKHFILRGGNFQPYAAQFQDFVGMVWRAG